MGLLPALVVGISMFAIRNIFLAMLLMHIVAMIPGVGLVTYISKGVKGFGWYMGYLRSQQFVSNCLWCVLLCLVGIGAIVAGYVLGSCRTYEWGMCIGRVNDNIAEYGFKEAPKWLIIACAVYFPLVNPFIEELFWRVFMDHEYLSEEVSNDPNLDEEQPMLNHPESPQATQFMHESMRVPVLVRIYFSCLFASYHTMVVGVFLGSVEFGVASFFGLTGLGLILQFIFASSPSDKGFYRAVALHVGIDAGVVIALGDAIGWYSLV